MTEDNLSIPLAMVSASQEPVLEVRDAKAPSRFTRYNFIQLVQKLGLLLVIAVLSSGSYYVSSRYVVNSIEVVGRSMAPTLQEGGHYLLNCWAFRNRDPQRSDIVVIRDPGDHGLSVKRVIAVGGQLVHFKNGFVYVDGKKLSEPYLPAYMRTFTYSQTKERFIRCGKDQYFVLGDNRVVSVDSRSYGPVSRKDILGLVKE